MLCQAQRLPLWYTLMLLLPLEEGALDSVRVKGSRDLPCKRSSTGDKQLTQKEEATASFKSVQQQVGLLCPFVW